MLGLYVGFSLLTVFEFFELFASLVWICVIRHYRGPSATATASVGTTGGNSAMHAGDGKNSIRMHSPRPPAYDQFRLFSANKKLPNVDC